MYFLVYKQNVITQRVTIDNFNIQNGDLVNIFGSDEEIEFSEDIDSDLYDSQKVVCQMKILMHIFAEL